MNEYVKLILSKIDSWRKSEVNKQPLSSENAYSLSAVGKKKSMTELYNDFFNEITKRIKDTARYGHKDILIHYPEWLCEDHKIMVINKLEDLGYKILFNNENMVLISWKVK